MRESKSKSRKTNDSNIDESNALSLQMELELLAVKAKNSDLIKAHTKLVQENSELRNQIFSLQTDLVDLQAKYNNREAILKSLTQNMKRCTPNLIDVLNLFLQVSDSRRTSMLNGSDQVSDKGFTPKNKTITHTVKPHTVNGTVLNLVPTISLTRLNTTQQNLDYRNSLPSTSTSENNEEQQNENLSPNVDTTEVENESFVSKRWKNPPISNESPNGYLAVHENYLATEEHSSDESSQGEEEEHIHGLHPIQEESLCSSGRTSLGEVRIYLSRLSNEDLQARRSQNTTYSSTEANINDTCLNIETTVIENADDRVSKRLRADIMVFSPHTNSTRMEGDDSTFNDTSPRNSRKKLSVPTISAIQSAEVTPSTSVSHGDELLTFNGPTWLTTPSMSAMGDINVSTTKLDILKGLGLTPSPVDRSINQSDAAVKINEICSATPRRTPKICKRMKTRSNSETKDESPESSVENLSGNRSAKTFVSRQRGTRCDRSLSPTIVLERLENILPECRPATNSINIQILAKPEPNEYKNPPRKTGRQSKKSKAPIKSKSPKRSVKRKIKAEEEENPGSLQKKIREIQIRLSNYIPEPSENSVDSSTDGNQRPKRAARPTSLKDASLKGKLRRMF